MYRFMEKRGIKTRALAFVIAFITAVVFLTAVSGNALAESVIMENAVDYSETAPQENVSMVSLPDNMRAAVITPGIDFCTRGDMTSDEISIELDDVFANLRAIGLNTVLINTVNDGTAYYSTDMNSTENADCLTMALERAGSYSLNAYLIYDIDFVLSNCPADTDANDYLISETHRFAIKYLCAGIILTDYYGTRSSATFEEYMKSGEGNGYENWLYNITEYRFKTASGVIRDTDNSIAVGAMINDVWANSSSVDGGSATTDSVEAMYDGFSDTKAYVEKKYCDFVTVRSYGSITDPALPFDAVAEWWGKLCSDNSLPMYIIHYNEKIGTDSAGWQIEDQLLKQLTKAKSIPSYSGSIFNSYSSLAANPMGTTATITSYYADAINEESLFEDLSMTLPKELNFTTYEPVQEFAGTFDENFQVTLNGTPIKLNEAGKFYFEKPLTIGSNTFKITHKGKTYTYNIERKIITMKSIDDSIGDGKTLRVDGETSITISAIAYKGAAVTATINGETIVLKQKSGTLDDDDLNTNYARFSRKYTVPDGIIGTEQPLGTIVVSASYEGYSRTLYGAEVIVNADPEPIVSKIEAELFDADSVGTGEVVGTMDAVISSGETVKLVKLYDNYTYIYDAKTTGAELKPDFGQLPAGTLDYYKSTSGSYYITESGKRFSVNDAAVVDGEGIGTNALTVKSTGTYGGDSYIKIGLDKRISYRTELVGNSYYTAFDGDYNVDDFTSQYVYITFDNITSVTNLPSFEYNLVFSSGKWETVEIDGVPKFRLVLQLRQPGVFAGSGAYYNSDGDLMLTFEVMTNAIENYNIVIDPGHGYGKSADTLDPGAIGHVVEQEVNLAIAKELASQLKAAGVNTVRLQTENTFLLSALRPYYARQYGCDLYISIHANKVQGNDSARGVEAYYFNAFSQPLAASVSSSVAGYFKSNVYSDGIATNRGAKYSYYWVTLSNDFPSILLETGFVSNMEDAMAMADKEGQSGIAAAIISGIKNYISRSGISYSSDGGVEIPEGLTPETVENAVTLPEETVATTADAEAVPEETTEPEETSETTVATEEAEAPEETFSPEEQAAIDSAAEETEDANAEEVPIEVEDETPADADNTASGETEPISDNADGEEAELDYTEPLTDDDSGEGNETIIV